MEALRRSFKSHTSYGRRPANLKHEMQPILLDHDRHGGDSEVIVQVDGGGGNQNGDNSRIWREPSYDFWKIDETDSTNRNDPGGFEFDQSKKDDPTSKLIGEFLHKQRASGAQLSLDMDMEMDELRHETLELPPVQESSADSPTIWFQTPLSVSNETLQRKSGIMRSKAKSRLLDPPEHVDKRSGRVLKSTQLKSGNEEDDDDPFLDEDVPEDFRRGNFSLLTILQWVSLVFIIAALVCSLTVRSFKRKTLWDLPLWKWEVMCLVLICGRLVSGWFIRIIVFFIEQNFLLRKRVLYFVYGVRKAVQNCIWLGLVLVAWSYIFNKKVERETKSRFLGYITRILWCLLVGTLIWLVKTLLVKVLASSFHVSTFFDRIQESLFNQYVIETLSGPPVIEMQNIEKEEERTMAEVRRLQNAGVTVPADLKDATLPPKTRRIVTPISTTSRSSKLSAPISRKLDDTITIDHLHKLNNKNVSAWNMKRLMNIIRHGSLTTLDEQILQNTAEQDDNSKEIRSEIEAKSAARKIFHNVVKPGKKYITLQDLMRFMEEDEALRTMSIFEGAVECKRITKSSLKNWVVNAFRERRALALTLNDTKTAVNKLHHMVNIVVGIIIGVIWLMLLGIATSKVVVFAFSQVLLVAFVFGNTCKVVFESIIFLFVMHPFDVGDRCEIDGVQMVVEEMNILTSVFLRYDNLKIVYPNSTLATKAISNFYRSPDMGDAVDFCVHISTPMEKIDEVKKRIKNYIEEKKDHWYPDPLIVLKDVIELNRLQLAVWLNHTINHQDMGERWVRRALLVEEMVKIFKELDIEYRLYPLDVNVRALPSPASTRMPPNWTNPSSV